jgi:hypothetical protein
MHAPILSYLSGAGTEWIKRNGALVERSGKLMWIKGFSSTYCERRIIQH